MDTGVRFESVLMAGFSIDILSRPDLTDPRVTYLLHEMGEETRHSRLFVRLLAQVKPQAKNPLDSPIGRIAQHVVMPFLTAMPSLFCLLVLSGEEVPDLLQKLASEHPDTDPMIKAVSKYHRQEEARHLAFGRLLFPEQWAAAGPIERFLVRYLGLPHRHRHVRHDRAPRCVRHGRPADLADVARRQPLRRPHGPAPPGPAPAAHAATRGGRLPWRPRPQGLADRLRRRPRRARTSTRLRRPDPVPPRAPPTRRKGDRTRQALLDAAVVRFAREGYRGTSVADVCRDAGLSTTASYPYFANKEALFIAAVDEDVAGLIDDAVSLVVIDEDPEQWGRVIMRALVAHVDAHPLAGRILRGLEPDFTMRLLHIPALEELRKTVTELIRAQQMAGDVRRDIEPARRPTAWWSS